MKIVEILLVTLNSNHETDIVYENNATYVKISNKHDFYELFLKLILYIFILTLFDSISSINISHSHCTIICIRVRLVCRDSHAPITTRR
jgi:hypothetical protein